MKSIKSFTGSAWYKGFATGANAELGIKSVQFKDPNGEHARVVKRVIITMDNDLVVYGTLFRSRDMQNFTFGVDQRKYQDASGQTSYTDINVNVPLSIQAHVLNFAESLSYTVEAPVAPAITQPVAPPAQTPAVEAIAQVEAQAPASNNPFQGIDPAVLGNMSQEELIAQIKG